MKTKHNEMTESTTYWRNFLRQAASLAALLTVGDSFGNNLTAKPNTILQPYRCCKPSYPRNL